MSDGQERPEATSPERITVRVDDGETSQLLTFRRALGVGATLAAAGLTAAMLESVVADEAFAQEPSRVEGKPGLTTMRAMPLSTNQLNMVQALDEAIKDRSTSGALERHGSMLTPLQQDALLSLTQKDLASLEQLRLNPRLNKLGAAADNNSGSIGGNIF
jgi:hypothetical protein